MVKEEAFYDVPRVQDSLTGKKRHLYASLIFDIFLCGVIYVTGGLLYLFIPPLPFYFSPYDTHLMYPIKPDHISNELMAVISWLIPLVTIAGFSSIIFKNKWDMIYGLKGCLESLTLSFLLSAAFWVTISDVRPNFLTKCKPDYSKIQPHVLYDKTICTGNLNNSDFHAFPSGHMSTSVASWLFIALYLTHNFKPWDKTAHLWKLVICLILPLILPVWVGITRLNDNKHTGYQVIGGAIIGVITGVFTYKLNFSGNVCAKIYWKEKRMNAIV